VAKGYHKLLAYKDEYEVARLHLETAAKARAEFDGDLRLTYHLAPPMLPGPGPDGRPEEAGIRRRGSLRSSAAGADEGLRGTPLDPFGYTRRNAGWSAR
jgi:indolepyruvate ferredoxin oxidoreductase